MAVRQQCDALMAFTLDWIVGDLVVVEIILKDDFYLTQYFVFSRLKTELQFLRKKGALKTGGQSDQPQVGTTGAGLDHHRGVEVVQSGNGRCCARCRTGLGRIINRGALCKSCRQRVCKACREYTAPRGSANGTEWVCTVCYKTAWVDIFHIISPRLICPNFLNQPN